MSRTFIAFLIVLAALSVLAHCGHVIGQSKAAEAVQSYNTQLAHADE